jgi:hypothetical protein
VGILHHASCPHTHQQNGSAERKHRHIVEVELSLLAHAAMPLKFWDAAFCTVVYLINQTPSRVIEFSSPYAKLFGSSPDYTWLKVFECSCWPHLWPYNSRKLAFRPKQCVFLGYSPSHKGYKCLDICTGRLYISGDVVFDEGLFSFANLHPNVGAHLRAKISLLPSSLCTLNNDHGNDIVADHVAHGADPVIESHDVQETSSIRMPPSNEAAATFSSSAEHVVDQAAATNLCSLSVD